MRNLLAILIALTILFPSCSTSKSAGSSASNTMASGSEGSSTAMAIPVNETSETKGVAAEYKWLGKHYPGYSSEGQALLFSKEGHPYDLIHIKTADGKKKDIYFDIIKFYGQF